MKYRLGIYLIEINFIYKYFFYSLKLALKLFIIYLLKFKINKL